MMHTRLMTGKSPKLKHQKQTITKLSMTSMMPTNLMERIPTASKNAIWWSLEKFNKGRKQLCIGWRKLLNGYQPMSKPLKEAEEKPQSMEMIESITPKNNKNSKDQWYNQKLQLCIKDTDPISDESKQIRSWNNSYQIDSKQWPIKHTWWVKNQE